MNYPDRSIDQTDICRNIIIIMDPKIIINGINNSIPFKDYLFKDRRNKKILIIALPIIIIQFAVFKYFYPYAGYIHGDSFSYLDTAYQNLSINTYMVGYSMFLRAFSVFSTSDTALVALQYFLLHSSALFFLFTLFYFYKPGKILEIILLCFMLGNPLFLYMANLVSSDALFLALSLTWFSLLLWIIHQPNTRVILLQTLILYVAFTVRYNALIYPFISIIAYALSKMPLRIKIVAVVAGMILTGAFVAFTAGKYKALTGSWQYSPFSGWQMANNAMYAYRYVDSSKRKPVPTRFKVLDNMIRAYFDSTRDIKKNPQEALEASTVYMWDPHLTLYKYRELQFKKDSTAPELKRWASMGPFYSDYGTYIIRQYPWYYVRHFIWPNANKYYAPPVEFLEAYNSGKDSTAPIAQKWFGYKSLRMRTRTKDLSVSILDFYPILSGIINVVMFFGLLFFFLLKGFHEDTPLRKGLLLGGIVWLLNAGFTIFASSAALRFQSFPILLTTTFVGLLVNWLAKMASVKNEATDPLIIKALA